MSSNGQKLDDPSVMEVTGKILIATIVALFLVLVLVFCFHLYAKWLWHRRQQGMDGHNHRRQQQQQQQHSGVTVLRRGLDASFLKTIPVVELDPKHLKEGLECAVCLSELQEGERSRILPKCSHVFHAECIDMWFHSHATCPICRNPVSEQTEKVSVESLLEEVEESRNVNGGGGGGDFPTNMLFWGDETEVSTLTSQLDQDTQALEASSSSSSSEETNNNDRAKPDLVIDIPSSRQHEGEDEKTPVLSRMQSLRRMLSSGSRFNPFSPNNAQQTNH